MSGCVLGFECNGGGQYQSRNVYYYLGGRRRGHFDASDACVFSMCFKHRSIGIARAKLGVE